MVKLVSALLLSSVLGANVGLHAFLDKLVESIDQVLGVPLRPRYYGTHYYEICASLEWSLPREDNRATKCFHLRKR